MSIQRHVRVFALIVAAAVPAAASFAQPPSSCSFEIPTHRLQFPNYGGQKTVTVPAPAGCLWTATIPNATGFFTIVGPSSGTGPGSVQVSSAATGTIGHVEFLSINGQSITLSETVPYIRTDTPANEAAVTEPLVVAGWALESDPEVSGTAVDLVHVYARLLTSGGPSETAIFLGAADIGIPRSDIAAAFGSQYLNAGWQFSVRSLPSGFYNIEVYMHSIHSGWVTASFRRYTITAAAPRTQILIDSIANGETVTSPFLISGWAIDTAAPSGTGVDTVHVWAYPADGSAPRFVGVANYGSQRTDIGQLFGAAFAPSGFALAGRLAPGAYTVVTFAHSTLTNTFAGVAAAAITVAGNAQPIVIFTGGNRLGGTGGSAGTFSLSVAAIDERASTGAGVDLVHVWAYPIGGGSPVFLGASGTAAANPIMAAAFGQQFLNCQFTIANQLPPAGTYDVVFYGRSTVTGQFDVVRVKRYVSP